MKCKECKSKMERTATQTRVEAWGEIKTVVNVPAYQCPACGATVIPDMAEQRCKGFAKAKAESIIDFEQCIQEENDAMTVLSMLWG